MKVCSACGATYSDRIDFCFHDGSPLSAHSGSAAEAPVPRTLRADVSDNRSRRRSILSTTADAPPPRVVSRPSVPAAILEAPDFIAAPLPAIQAEPPRTFKAPAPPPAPEPETFEWVAPPPPIGADPEEAPPVPIQRQLTPKAEPPPPPPDPSEEPTAEVSRPNPDITPLHVTSDETPSPVVSSRSHDDGAEAAWDASPPPDGDDEPEPTPARPAWLIPVIAVVGLLAILSFGAMAMVAIGGAALTGVEAAQKPPQVIVPPPVPVPPPPQPAVDTDTTAANVPPPEPEIAPEAPPPIEVAPEAPKPEAPKAEPPKPKEAPKPEAPKPEALKPEAPKPEPPKPEAPKPEPPKPKEPPADNPWGAAPEPAPTPRVSIFSKGSGGEVTVDGATKCVLPCFKPLAAGPHTFVLADGTTITKEVTADTKMIELP